MFRTVSLSIIRSFSLYTQQWYMSYRFADEHSLLIVLSIYEFDVRVTVHRDKFF